MDEMFIDVDISQFIAVVHIYLKASMTFGKSEGLVS
jgi:hypothetical protein